jgi:hypothetical protein
MQACNLQNLPENYTMRYCIHPRLVSSLFELPDAALRPIPCHDLAITVLRRRRRQGTHRWLCTSEDVGSLSLLYSLLFPNSNGGPDASGKKILLLEMNRMDT